MNTHISAYIGAQPKDRQTLLSAIHDAIIRLDKTVDVRVAPMMGKEMLLYECKGMMKYGLSGVKNHMSLHLLPMYGSPVIYEKYKALLDKARFQKGCINFNAADEIPMAVLEDLIRDCAKVDLHRMREEQLNARKKKNSGK